MGYTVNQEPNKTGSKGAICDVAAVAGRQKKRRFATRLQPVLRRSCWPGMCNRMNGRHQAVTGKPLRSHCEYTYR